MHTLRSPTARGTLTFLVAFAFGELPTGEALQRNAPGPRKGFLLTSLAAFACGEVPTGDALLHNAH